MRGKTTAETVLDKERLSVLLEGGAEESANKRKKNDSGFQQWEGGGKIQEP